MAMDHLGYIRIHGLVDSDSEIFQGTTISIPSSGNGMTPISIQAPTMEAGVEAGDFWSIIETLMSLSDTIVKAYWDLLFPKGSRGLKENKKTRQEGAPEAIAVIERVEAIAEETSYFSAFKNFSSKVGGGFKALGEGLSKDPIKLAVVLQIANFVKDIVYDIIQEQDKQADAIQIDRIISILKKGLLHLPPGVTDTDGTDTHEMDKHYKGYAGILKAGLLELTQDKDNEDVLVAYLSGVFDLALQDLILKFKDNVSLSTKGQYLQY
jgi:hypothetical protein